MMGRRITSEGVMQHHIQIELGEVEQAASTRDGLPEPPPGTLK
jgi:hypothetical protein